MSSRFNIPVAAAYAGMCLIWSSTWMVIKVGLRGAPPLTSVAVRMAIASLLVELTPGFRTEALRGSPDAGHPVVAP